MARQKRFRTPDPQIRSLVIPITRREAGLFAARCIMAWRLKRPCSCTEIINAARGRAPRLTAHSCPGPNALLDADTPRGGRLEKMRPSNRGPRRSRNKSWTNLRAIDFVPDAVSATRLLSKASHRTLFAAIPPPAKATHASHTGRPKGKMKSSDPIGRPILRAI